MNLGGITIKKFAETENFRLFAYKIDQMAV